MVDNETGSFGALGYIVVFSFVSSIFLFVTMLIIASFNNYALYDILQLAEQFVTAGLIPELFAPIFVETAETLVKILPYLDIIWFGSFISLVISSLVLSYIRKRENYFNILTMSVLGLIIFTYVGGIFIQLTDWFKDEILLKVFPTLADITPIFSWYLEHIGIVNLVLISLNIIVNFVDLDFSKFNKRKEGESFDEI